MAGVDESKDPQLVLGTVRGYRAWQVHEGYLHPTSINMSYISRVGSTAGALPQSAGPHRAGCAALLPCEFEDFEHGRAPQVNCTCGFYAVYEAPGLYNLRRHADPFKLMSGRLVIGSVQMSGRVIKGSTGVMRAENMTLEAFLDLGHGRTHRAVSSAYGIPLLKYAQFLEKFPLASRNDHQLIGEIEAGIDLEQQACTWYQQLENMQVVSGPVVWPQQVPTWFPNWLPTGRTWYSTGANFG